MIKQSIASAVLEEALKTGADYSELFMQDSEFNNVQMVDGRVESATYQRKVGAGVRVLKGTSSAYAYTADTSEPAIMEAARAAAAALNGVKGTGASASFEVRSGSAPYERRFADVSNDERIALLREAQNGIHHDHKEDDEQVRIGFLLMLHHILVHCCCRGN